MNKDTLVSTFLSDRGCADHVVKGGLSLLMENWEQVMKLVESGYSCGLDDYLNDLDGRQILEEALAVAPPMERARYTERLRQTDERIRTFLLPAGKCLWGDDAAVTQGWNADTNWWYFMKPADASPEMLEEIENA
jgi:hypothetical protein